MPSFLHDFMAFEYVRTALLAGLLASIACGVVGTYVVVRRISYIAASISHCVLGGMGAARFLRVHYGWEWLDPLYGAVVAALLAAVIIGLVSMRAKEREDTIIGAVWAVGMAIGVLFIFKTPGYNADLMNYLFGNILLVSHEQLWFIATLDAVVLLLALIFYNPLMAVCFDEQFARLRGVPVEGFYLLLLSMIALTVVLLVSVVGIILVIALLTLPVAVAGIASRTLGQMMLVATLVSGVITTSGFVVAYTIELPPGATMIVLAGAVYLVAILGRWAVLRGRHA